MVKNPRGLSVGSKPQDNAQVELGMRLMVGAGGVPEPIGIRSAV